jgi:Domain of unknown function (DUF3846)
MKLLALRPDQIYEIVETSEDDQLKTMQTLVGGMVELVMPRSEHTRGHCIYVNEEGALIPLPLNTYATRIMQKLGYNTREAHIYGVVLVCGSNTAGEDVTLSDRLIARIKSLHEDIIKKLRDDSPVRDR